MRVFAIDTALQACAAAVLDTARGEVLATESMDLEHGHAEALMPLITRVMDASGCEFSEIDRIAVTVGPGSFTGLRVGISAARGLALAAGIPAVGLSTLSAFAAPSIAAGSYKVILSAIDARHGNVYLQIFSGRGETLVGPTLAPVSNAVRAAMTGPTLIVGSAAVLIAQDWPVGAPPPIGIEGRAAPDIGWVARLGAVAEPQNAPAKPLYLRKPDARPQDAARLPRQ